MAGNAPPGHQALDLRGLAQMDSIKRITGAAVACCVTLSYLCAERVAPPDNPPHMRDQKLSPSLASIVVVAAVVSACASEKPVPPGDVAPVLAAVVHAVDSAVGPRDSIAIDPRILPRPSMLRRKPVSTAWSEGEPAAAISPRHPRLELGKMAFSCPVSSPECVATKELPVVALSMPVVRRDTVMVEARYAGRAADQMVNRVHWLWFAVKKDSAWTVVKHTALDQT